MKLFSLFKTFFTVLRNVRFYVADKYLVNYKFKVKKELRIHLKHNYLNINEIEIWFNGVYQYDKPIYNVIYKRPDYKYIEAFFYEGARCPKKEIYYNESNGFYYYSQWSYDNFFFPNIPTFVEYNKHIKELLEFITYKNIGEIKSEKLNVIVSWLDIKLEKLKF